MKNIRMPNKNTDLKNWDDYKNNLSWDGRGYFTGYTQFLFDVNPMAVFDNLSFKFG